jgi:hypothetical protein
MPIVCWPAGTSAKENVASTLVGLQSGIVFAGAGVCPFRADTAKTSDNAILEVYLFISTILPHHNRLPVMAFVWRQGEKLPHSNDAHESREAGLRLPVPPRLLPSVR